MTVLSFAFTSKHPFLGLSALIVHEMPSDASAFSSLAARVLNAPHDLHASMETCVPPFALAGDLAGDLAGAFAFAAFVTLPAAVLLTVVFAAAAFLPFPRSGGGGGGGGPGIFFGMAQGTRE